MYKLLWYVDLFVSAVVLAKGRREERLPIALTVVVLRILHILLKAQNMYIKCGFMR
jgi:hypothetical protein